VAKPGWFAAAVVFLVPGSAISLSAAEGQPATFHRFIKKAFGPTAVVKAAIGGAITQATNTPSEWGQGAAGFGRRFASSFGKNIVKNGIQYPVARFRHEALGYQRSEDPRFGPRLRHALLATVITQKTTTGKKTVATGEIAGAIGSGLISRLWQPASVRTVAAGFGSAGVALAADAGTNVLREFWPEIRHPHSHQAVQRPEPSVHPSPNP